MGTQLDSVGLTCIHLVPLGPTGTRLASLAQTLIHSDSLVLCCLTRSHSNSLGFTRTTWPHLCPLGHTKSHMVSQVFEWTHLDSFGFPGPHLVSLGLIWFHLD